MYLDYEIRKLSEAYKVLSNLIYLAAESNIKDEKWKPIFDAMDFTAKIEEKIKNLKQIQKHQIEKEGL